MAYGKLPNGDAPKEQAAFRKFRGMLRRQARTAMPPEAFWYLSNMQPVGDANLRSVYAASKLGTITGSTSSVYATRAWTVTLGSNTYVLAQNADGLYAAELSGTPPYTFNLIYSGQINDVTDWNSQVALLVGASGYYSWGGSGSITPILSTDYQTLTYGTSSGTITAGDTLSNGSGTTGTISSVNTTLKQIVVTHVAGPGFAVGDTVTDTTTSGTATLTAVDVPGPPTSGTSIAVYASRVWISQGRTVSFSGPGDYSAASWDVALGDGAFTIQDDTLTGDIVKLAATNGYLYIIGPTSVDVVSNVFVPAGASPPTPIFNRQNVNAVVGSPYASSVVVADRSVAFYNRYGFYLLTGVDVRRISADIDDIIAAIDPNAPALVSGSVGTSNNIPFVQFLISWFDPDFGSLTRQTILTFTDGKWWLYDPFGISQQAGQYIGALVGGYFNSTLTSFALLNTTDSGSTVMALYQLFDASNLDALQRTVKTALLELGGPLWLKQALKLGAEGTVTDPAYTIQAYLDSETSTTAGVTLLPNTVQWINPLNQMVSWKNPAGQPVVWVVPGYVFGRSDISQIGRYLGVTLAGSTGRLSINGMYIQYERRTPWSEVP